MKLNETNLSIIVIGLLFLLPYSVKKLVDYNYSYINETGPKTLGNVSYPPIPDIFGGTKHKKKCIKKSRKLRR
jgi:hypothetical protein